MKTEWLLLGVLLAVSILEILIFLVFSSVAQVVLLIAQIPVSGYGWLIFRKHDWKDLFFVDAELKKGNRIVSELWHHALCVLASILLIFPGLFSNAAGALMLSAQFREWMIDQLLYEKTL